MRGNRRFGTLTRSSADFPSASSAGTSFSVGPPVGSDNYGPKDRNRLTAPSAVGRRRPATLRDSRTALRRARSRPADALDARRVRARSAAVVDNANRKAANSWRRGNGARRRSVRWRWADARSLSSRARPRCISAVTNAARCTSGRGPRTSRCSTKTAAVMSYRIRDLEHALMAAIAIGGVGAARAHCASPAGEWRADEHARVNDATIEERTQRDGTGRTKRNGA